MRDIALKYSSVYFILGLVLVVLSSYMANVLGEYTTPFAAEVSRGIFLVTASSFLLYLFVLQSNKSFTENKNQYKRLFEENPNPMWVYELETLNVMAVNQAALQTYGYTENEFLNLTLLQLRPGSEHEKLLKDVKLESPTYSNSGTWLHMRKNGEIFFVSIFSHRTHFNDKRARLVLALDINDKLLAQKRILAQNDKLREIAHMQSHNVRRPVASILGLINLFDKRNPANEMNGIVIDKLDVVCKELDQTIHQIVEKTYELEVENQQLPQ